MKMSEEEDQVAEATPLLQQEKHRLENLDLDRLLKHRLGEFGRYQRFVYLLVCLPAALTAAITMASVFTLLSPRHRCLVEACDSPTIPHYRDAFVLGFANFTIPKTGADEWESCSSYTQLVNATTCNPSSFSGQNATSCSRLLYDQDIVKSNIVSQFGLVCSEAWKVPMAESVFFCGVLAGAIVFGQLGDLIGRKKVFLVSMVQTLGCGLVAAFAPSYTAFSVAQFLTAMAQVGVFQSAYVLGVELVGERWREFCGVFIEFFFVLGELILAGLAWALRDARSLSLAYLLPSLLFLGYYFPLPKSIRWLLMNQRYEEAEQELQRVAKWNRVAPLTPDDFVTYAKESQEEERSTSNDENFVNLLRRPRLVLRLFVVFFAWTVTTMVYYGLSMNAAGLAGDVYLNFSLLALTEVPGYLASYFGMSIVGRKPTMLVSLVGAGLACLASSLVPTSLTALQTTCFLLGKLFVTSAFGTAYLYTSELFPTRVRNLCVGLSSMMGRIGAIVSPYVVALDKLTGLAWLPMAVFAAGAIVSGFSIIVLPETKGRALPRTMAEAEQLAGQQTATGQLLQVEEEEE